MARLKRLVLSRADERVLVSPVRHELLSAIGLHGPCSVRELASRLGRSVTSLYYHLGLLERVGAIAQEKRGSDVVWRTAADRITLAPSRRSSSDRSSQATVVKAAMRLSLRELDAALRDTKHRRGEPARRLVAVRSRAWLDKDQLHEIEQHFEAIIAILQRAETARRGASIHAVTLALAPVRETGPRGRVGRKAGSK
jgi:DNA-binding transcriptional ArsR family regulator